jgi:hypothetical protein
VRWVSASCDWPRVERRDDELKLNGFSEAMCSRSSHSLSQKAVHLTAGPLANDAIPFLLRSLSVRGAKRLLPLLAVYPIGDIPILAALKERS